MAAATNADRAVERASYARVGQAGEVVAHLLGHPVACAALGPHHPDAPRVGPRSIRVEIAQVRGIRDGPDLPYLHAAMAAVDLALRRVGDAREVRGLGSGEEGLHSGEKARLREAW